MRRRYWTEPKEDLDEQASRARLGIAVFWRAACDLVRWNSRALARKLGI